MSLLDRFRRRHAIAPSAPAVGFHSTATAPPAPKHIAPGEPHFAVLDVETTGLSAAQHRIVEIAVVTTDPWGRVLGEWGTRINPQGPVGATHIHGISDADVANAPAFADVIAQLNQRLAGAAIAAHHAKFDLAFLRAEYARAGWDMPHLPALCTLEASDYHLPMLDRRRLADCCWAVGTPLIGAHSALGDASATASLLAAFMHPHVGYPPLPEHVENANQGAWRVLASRSLEDSVAS
jgi:DNA polymerase-3 subunit epsilon